MVVLQIETKLAVERRDELLSVPGIDAIMIGPADLSISLGVPGEFDHPKMIETIELVKESCLKHGVAPGIHLRALSAREVLERTRHEVFELRRGYRISAGERDGGRVGAQRR